MAENNIIRYIVVVHGIGEQRKNETILNVVNRFAEARQDLSEKEMKNILTLGRATGQTGKDLKNFPCRYPVEKHNFTPWAEFKGIPQTPPETPPDTPFLGEISKDGTNLRFVDLCWSDIMQEDWPEVGQPVETWARGLLGRLKIRYEQGKVEGWVPLILQKLVETLLLVRKLMSFRFKKMEDLIFSKFLGDVQLYGEYSRTRGKAVRRFHRLMARIEQAHSEKNPDKEARYTIIAHSLGSIMSFDALMYAHVKLGIRTAPGGNTPTPNLPFPGHFRGSQEDVKKNKEIIEKFSGIKKEELSNDDKTALKEAQNKVGYLDNQWIKRVDSFVTLGSPIDKFLVMWWLNYEYLDNPEKWFQDDLRGKKILHLNYCDEQDPVGHELDKARQKAAYKKVFQGEGAGGEDRVFTRYLIPGAAHNEYWNDLELFKRILIWAVDDPTLKNTEPPSVKWFKRGVYKRALTINYKLVPWAVVFLDYFVFTWALYAQSLQGAALASLATIGVWYLGRQLIDILIWWRQILLKKAETRWDSVKDHDREKLKARFRRRLIWAPLLLLGLAGVCLGYFWQYWDHILSTNFLLFIAIALGVCLLAWLNSYLQKEKMEADPIQKKNDRLLAKETCWEIYGKVGTCLIVSVALGYGLHLTNFLPDWLPDTVNQPLIKDPEKFTPAHLWFNLTVFFFIAAGVMTYQSVRHSSAKEKLG